MPNAPQQNRRHADRDTSRPCGSLGKAGELFGDCLPDIIDDGYEALTA